MLDSNLLKRIDCQRDKRYSCYFSNVLKQKDNLTLSAAAAKSLQSCPTLCDPIDGSPLGSSVPGILQARILEWVAFPSAMHESEK